jgi:integrase
MGRQRGGERYLGPYTVGDGRWRVVYVPAGGTYKADGVSFTFATESAAKAKLAEGRRELRDEGLTVGALVEGYAEHLTAKGNNQEGVKVATKRVVSIVGGEETMPLSQVTPATAREWFLRAAKRTVRRLVRDAAGWPVSDPDGKPLYEEKQVSPTTSSQALVEVRSAWNWGIGRGMVKTNPWTAVKPLGHRRRRKAQHHRDEARAFLDEAVAQARDGGESALCLATALTLGARPGEVLYRQVRDLDDNGATLCIDESKTDASARRLAIPAFLQPLLAALAAGKEPTDYLFAHRGESVLLKAAERICQRAGVPRTVPYALRGTHASLSVEEGATSEVVAAALGHRSATTTEGHYIRPQALSAARQRRAAKALGTEEIPVIPLFGRAKAAR